MKKILSVIIAALMIFTALPFAAAEDGVYNPFCDLDGDGHTGASDVVMLRKMLFDTDPGTAGDINDDGKIDKADSKELRKLMSSL